MEHFTSRPKIQIFPDGEHTFREIVMPVNTKTALSAPPHTNTISFNRLLQAELTEQVDWTAEHLKRRTDANVTPEALCFISGAFHVFPCACLHHNKGTFLHFWAAITVPLRKVSRWVWNMQQFVWSLRCLFRTAFACDYNKVGSVPRYSFIPFVPPCLFFNVQPTSITAHHASAEIALNLEEWLQDCNYCKKKMFKAGFFRPWKLYLFRDKLIAY